MANNQSGKRFNVGAFMKAKRALIQDLAEQKAAASKAVKMEQQKIRRLKNKVYLCLFTKCLQVIIDG